MTRWNGGRPLEVLTLGLQGEIFALEATYVREIIDLVSVTEVPNSDRFATGLINVRGKVIPLADLRVKFGLERTAATIDSRTIVIEVAIDGAPTIVGLHADRVFEITELPAEALEDTPRTGMRWSPEYIRCIGKRGTDFIFVLELEQIFMPQRPRAGSLHGAMPVPETV